MSGEPTDLFVDGAWTPGTAGVFPVVDPATGQAIAEVARAGPTDVTRALDAAAAALASWTATSPRTRADVLSRCHGRLTADSDRLAMLVSRETGKPLVEARAEVAYAADYFRWFADGVERVGGELRIAPNGSHRILTVKRPIGVALLVTPWNFPIAMAARKIAPALAAGCTVVLKPAEDAPLSALALAQILADAGAPAGVVNVVTTDQPAGLVAAALGDDRVRKLSFTGSTEVGRQLLGLAASRIVNVSLELGGNNPFLVLDDADVESAVDGALIAKMRNGGQACTAANRFIVDQRIADVFCQALVEALSRLRVGPGTDEATDLGPVINGTQRARIDHAVQATIAAGARLRLGGTVMAGDGFFYPPTVLADVPCDAEAVTTEIFGPVASIITVAGEDEAVAVANATTAGLAAYVYAGDLGRALRVAERLHAGMVGLNRGLLSSAAAPFGGVKESGLGREGGLNGIDEYLETMYLSATW